MPKAEKTTTKTIEAEDTTTDTISPDVFKIGGPATEAVIEGGGLDEPGLKASVYTLEGIPDDPLVVIEQPLPDGVTAKKFPITITVLDGAESGYRTVAIMQDGNAISEMLNIISIVH